MKKIMTAVLALAFCFLPLSAQAAEYTVSEGGLTLEIPEEFTVYTEEDIAEIIYENNEGVLDDISEIAGAIIDAFDAEIIGEIADIAEEIARLVDGGLSDAEAARQFPGDLRLIAEDAHLSYSLRVYGTGDDYYDLEDYSYLNFRDDFSDDWLAVLEDQGYTADRYDAVIRETENGIPYIRLDGTSGSGCCRLAVFYANGYYDMVLFMSPEEETFSDESEEIWDSLLDSVEVSLSPDMPEARAGEEKYGELLVPRVELDG